jgi:hypothetical protein
MTFDPCIFQMANAGIDIINGIGSVWAKKSPHFYEIKRELINSSRADIAGHRDPCNMIFDKSAVIGGDSSLLKCICERTGSVLGFDVVKLDGFRRG